MNMNDPMIQQGQQDYQTASDNAKTFSQMLADRRAFVNSSEQGVYDQAKGAIQNGSNGVAISPAALLAPFMDWHASNANKTAELNQESEAKDAQAANIWKALSDYITQQGQLGVQQDANNINKQNTNLQYKTNGFDAPYGTPGGSSTSGTGGAPASTAPGSTGNSVIDETAKNLKEGRIQMTDLDKLTPYMKSQVLKQAYAMGYDPAKDVNGVIDGLEHHFFNQNAAGASGNNGSIAQGGDPWNTLGNGISEFINSVTHGAVPLGAGKINSYDDFAKGNSQVLQQKLGVTTDDLPKLTDSAETAKAKIAALRKAVADKFYQGGQLPNASSASGGFVIKKIGN